MPRRLPVRRRPAGDACRPLGVARTSWRYTSRTLAVHRVEEAVGA